MGHGFPIFLGKTMNTTNLQNIKKKVMLASLNISAWTGRAFDNKATGTVERSFASSKIGRFNKDLMPGKPESFDSLLKAGTRIRKDFSTYTLAYQQDGVRLMPAGVYLEYSKQIRDEQKAYEGLVEKFISEYEDIKLDSQHKLGDLYNEDDYPNIPTLRDKFGINFWVLPFPDAEDFGVELPAAELFEEKRKINSRMQNAIDFAHDDLSTRLYDATLKLAQRAASDGKFHSSALENLREIIQILPKLNFSEDKRLTELANQASRELTVFDVDALRSQPSLRRDVADRATGIALEMSEYMGKPFDNSLLYDDSSDQLDLLTA